MSDDQAQDMETRLENMRKSRDEFKMQVSTLRITDEVKSAHIEEQREQIAKLIDAICALSKAVRR